jgi:hypothetical protein
MVAYDPVIAINYFNMALPPYWNRCRRGLRAEVALAVKCRFVLSSAVAVAVVLCRCHALQL